MLAGLALAWLLAGPITVDAGASELTPDALQRALEARVGEELEAWAVDVRVEGDQASVSYSSSWDQGDFEVELAGVGEDDVRTIASNLASRLTPAPAPVAPKTNEPPTEPGPSPEPAPVRPERYWVSLGAEAGGWQQAELGGGATFAALLLGGRLGLGVALSGRRTLTRRVSLDTVRAAPRLLVGSFVGRRVWIGAHLEPGVAVSFARGVRSEAFVSSSVTVGPTLAVGLTRTVGLMAAVGVEWIAPETRVVGEGGPISHGPVHVGGTFAVVFGR